MGSIPEWAVRAQSTWRYRGQERPPFAVVPLSGQESVWDYPRAAWTATTPMSFFSFPMYANIEMISPRPILLVAGENAHSRYYSEDVYKIASEPKELLIVPGADHVDLYDRIDKIPFDKLAEFFTKNLGVTTSTQIHR